MEYNVKPGREKEYEVAPGVVYFDNTSSKLNYGYNSESDSTPKFQRTRLMQDRLIVGQQEEVMQIGRANGYAREKRISMPYHNQKDEDDGAMAWTKIAPQPLDSLIFSAYKN